MRLKTEKKPRDFRKRDNPYIKNNISTNNEYNTTEKYSFGQPDKIEPHCLRGKCRMLIKSLIGPCPYLALTNSRSISNFKILLFSYRYIIMSKQLLFELSSTMK